MYLREKNLFKFSIERDFMQTTTNPELKKNDLNKYINKADELYKNNSFKDAISFYLNAILIDRSNPKSFFGLGLCYKKVKNYEKAILAFKKASELDKYYYEAFYEMGVCSLNFGYPEEALRYFIKAIQISPDNPDAISQLGISHELCGEPEMSLMIYQKLIENSPQYIKAYELKSSLLMKMEMYKEASIVLNQLLKVNPSHTSALAGIGICFDKLGKKNDAQRYYRKFLSSNSQLKQVEFVKNRLEKIKSHSLNKKYLSVV